MIREETVFGPIHSRRLGTSLGINLLPTDGKICNFDCIYCECGWNKDGTGGTRLPSAVQVRTALEAKLQALHAQSVELDSITFSGDGEPTLNPEFPQIIDLTLELRDKWCPKAGVSVLSNATRVHIPEIFQALSKVDNPILKLDAPTDKLVARINRPVPGYSVERAIEGMKRFNGNFCLQTMFLRKGDDFCSTDPEVLDGWLAIACELHPRLIMAYTIDRPTPESGLEKISAEEMSAALRPLTELGFNVQICG